jgi:hypothetical protein
MIRDHTPCYRNRVAAHTCFGVIFPRHVMATPKALGFQKHLTEAHINFKAFTAICRRGEKDMVFN